MNYKYFGQMYELCSNYQFLGFLEYFASLNNSGTLYVYVDYSMCVESNVGGSSYNQGDGYASKQNQSCCLSQLGSEYLPTYEAAFDFLPKKTYGVTEEDDDNDEKDEDDDDIVDEGHAFCLGTPGIDSDNEATSKNPPFQSLGGIIFFLYASTHSRRRR